MNDGRLKLPNVVGVFSISTKKTNYAGCRFSLCCCVFDSIMCVCYSWHAINTLIDT